MVEIARAVTRTLLSPITLVTSWHQHSMRNAQRCLHIVPDDGDSASPCCEHVKKILDRLPTI